MAELIVVLALAAFVAFMADRKMKWKPPRPSVPYIQVRPPIKPRRCVACKHYRGGDQFGTCQRPGTFMQGMMVEDDFGCIHWEDGHADTD